MGVESQSFSGQRCQLYQQSTGIQGKEGQRERSIKISERWGGEKVLELS